MVELYSARGCYTSLEVKDMTDNYAKKIGEGFSGTVYHGQLLTGQEVAVKVWRPGFGSCAYKFERFQSVSSPNP
jgi:RIO-like serine/threonine protein kinase